MKYAILAAGEGSRLAEEGVQLPKPLVRLCGEPMIDRLIRVFTQCGASEIDIIVNDLHASTLEHLSEVSEQNPLVRFKVKSTPSSMHSFFELMPMLGEGKFCLTTVDTIFREEEFQEFISQFEQSEADGMMAVTDFVDDEKPLYISTDAGLRITGFHDIGGGCQFISGGIYCLSDKAFPTLVRCIEAGKSRMRNFQRQLIEDGLRLVAYPFSKILDVDHASDIPKAEAFLREL
ncbi:MAG: NTP transferase domain-containing protein [Prevotellaceae bacterium]|nr:NTP transferase domain-containing protein [Prevotellaceae bacterium]